MYLLDTNVCIEFLRGTLPDGYDLMQQSDPGLFKVPSVVAAELYFGAAKSNRSDENRRTIESFLYPLEVIPFDSSCAIAYASIRAELEEQGCGVGPNDLMIAATAVSRQAVLITNNVQEFKRVPALQIESWHELPLATS